MIIMEFSKFKVAIRQVETALGLFFSGEDLFS
jgi:hypothetical protein